MLTDLVEAVDLAARTGWSCSETLDGGLSWVRGGHQVFATFAKGSQRLTQCYLDLLYYELLWTCDPVPENEELKRTPAAGGGRGEQGMALLRHCLSDSPRGFTDPTLEGVPCPVHDEDPPLAPVGQWPTFAAPADEEPERPAAGKVWIEYTEQGAGSGSARWGDVADSQLDAVLAAVQAVIGRPPDTLT